MKISKLSNSTKQSLRIEEHMSPDEKEFSSWAGFLSVALTHSLMISRRQASWGCVPLPVTTAGVTDNKCLRQHHHQAREMGSYPLK